MRIMHFTPKNFVQQECTLGKCVSLWVEAKRGGVLISTVSREYLAGAEG